MKANRSFRIDPGYGLKRLDPFEASAVRGEHEFAGHRPPLYQAYRVSDRAVLDRIALGDPKAATGSVFVAYRSRTEER